MREPHTTTIIAHYDAGVRAKALIHNYLRREDGPFIVYGGDIEDRPAILIEWTGEQHVLFVDEARKLAESLEITVENFPTFWGNDRIADLILALRVGADGAEETQCPPHSIS